MMPKFAAKFHKPGALRDKGRKATTLPVMPATSDQQPASTPNVKSGKFQRLVPNTNRLPMKQVRNETATCTHRTHHCFVCKKAPKVNCISSGHLSGCSKHNNYHLPTGYCLECRGEEERAIQNEKKAEEQAKKLAEEEQASKTDWFKQGPGRKGKPRHDKSVDLSQLGNF